MCHVLEPRYFVYYFVKCDITGGYYGLKRLTMAYNTDMKPTIKSHHFYTEYSFVVEGNGIRVFDKIKSQPILFKLPILRMDDRSIESGIKQFTDDFVEKMDNVRSGMHISPILVEYNGTRSNISADLTQTYIVRFSYDDIVFYDGKDIGVKCFKIPTPKFIENSDLLSSLFKPVMFSTLVEQHKRLFDFLKIEY